MRINLHSSSKDSASQAFDLNSKTNFVNNNNNEDSNPPIYVNPVGLKTVITEVIKEVLGADVENVRLNAVMTQRQNQNETRIQNLEDSAEIIRNALQRLEARLGTSQVINNNLTEERVVQLINNKINNLTNVSNNSDISVIDEVKRAITEKSLPFKRSYF